LPGNATVSLRGHTRGEIADFLDREAITCAHSNNVISGILGKLWNYKEEGEEISPSIVFTNDISTFIKSLPGCTKFYLGKCDANEDAAKRILKDCAPLTGENSQIFIERADDGSVIRYGIFSFPRSPTSLSMEEIVKLDIAQFAILIEKSSPTSLRIIGSKDSSVSILMSTVREEDNSQAAVDQFIDDLIHDIDDDKEDFRKYLQKVFSRELSKSHGTILICADQNGHPDLPSISDKISLEDGIDLYMLFKRFRNGSSAESLLGLQMAEDLLRGFLACDGMILFSTNGKISSYRVFFRPQDATDEPKVVGGARRRAFAGVSALQTDLLRSALFRSQDGTTEYKEITNEPV